MDNDPLPRLIVEKMMNRVDNGLTCVHCENGRLKPSNNRSWCSEIRGFVLVSRVLNFIQRRWYTMSSISNRETFKSFCTKQKRKGHFALTNILYYNSPYL